MKMNKLLLIIVAIFFPPIAVFLKKGIGKDWSLILFYA